MILRLLAATVVVANLAGAAWAATADAKDASPDATAAPAAPAAPAAAAPASTPETEAKDRGWFSRVNPFSPLINPEAMKRTPGDVSPEDIRPPETPDATTPTKAAAPATQAQPAPEIPKLNGVLFSERMVVAIVNDTIVKVGDLVNGYRITSIGRDTVEAEKGRVRFRMTTRRPQAEAETPTPATAEPASATPAEKTQSSIPPQTADKPGVDESTPGSEGTRPASAATEGCEQAP